jgi:hypothetical protein
MSKTETKWEIAKYLRSKQNSYKSEESVEIRANLIYSFNLSIAFTAVWGSIEVCTECWWGSMRERSTGETKT